MYLRDGSAHCHTEMKVVDQIFYLIQSQCTDTWLTSSRADPIMPGAWQSSHWSANFQVTGMTSLEKIPIEKLVVKPGSAVLEEDT